MYNFVKSIGIYVFAISCLWVIYLIHDMRVIFNPHDKVLSILNPTENNKDFNATYASGIITYIYNMSYKIMVLSAVLMYFTDECYRFYFKTKFLTYFGIIESD